MDAGTGRDECAVAFVFAGLIVDLIRLVVIRARFAGRLHIGLTVKFKQKLVACGPRIDQAGALPHVVFDLGAFPGLEFDLP